VLDPCTGIPESASQVFGMNVSPNPTNGIFTVTVTGTGNDKISITVADIAGKQIWSSAEAVSGSVLVKKIDLSRVQKGVYVVKATKGSETKVSKLVIQ
jgi:hypothetical protein